MYSFFFGSSAHKLYGAMEAGESRRTGVIICGSLGPEAQGSHRFLRIVGKRLAGEGISSMRFDYFGSGDSYGQQRDLSIDSMVRDTEAAVEELRDLRDVDRICLIGYRVGAMPALTTASQCACLTVLVDPVLEGEKWLRELVNEYGARRLDDGALETGGFVLGAELVEQLRTGYRQNGDGAPVEAVVVSSSPPAAIPGIEAAAVAFCKAPRTWGLGDGGGVSTVSAELVDTVVERIVNLEPDDV